MQRVRERLPWYVPHIAFEGPTIPEEGIEVFTSAYPFLVALEKSDEAMVYSMVKIMHTHFDEYKDNAPGAGGWTLDRQKFEQAFVPFHEGAIRYYKEIGAWTDRADENNQRNLYRQSILREAWNEFLPSAPDGYQEFEEAWTKYREQALAKVNLITLGQGL